MYTTDVVLITKIKNVFLIHNIPGYIHMRSPVQQNRYNLHVLLPEDERSRQFRILGYIHYVNKRIGTYNRTRHYDGDLKKNCFINWFRTYLSLSFSSSICYPYYYYYLLPFFEYIVYIYLYILCTVHTSKRVNLCNNKKN